MASVGSVRCLRIALHVVKAMGLTGRHDCEQSIDLLGTSDPTKLLAGIPHEGQLQM